MYQGHFSTLCYTFSAFTVYCRGHLLEQLRGFGLNVAVVVDIAETESWYCTQRKSILGLYWRVRTDPSLERKLKYDEENTENYPIKLHLY